MHIDITEFESGRTVEADICIIGAGIAGISIARTFLGSNLRVALLESGGGDYEPRIQKLAEGEICGFTYYPLADSRLRFFGGTTAIWDGRIAAMDSIDFQQRSWVSYSGWPLEPGELDPWYRRARQILDLPDVPTNEILWKYLGLNPPAFDQRRIRMAFWQFDNLPDRFSFERCADLRQADNISIITHATATHIQADRNGRYIRHVDVAAPDGSRIRVRARHFVLAAGGLENARLLLVSNDVYLRGLGNERELVGRFFMEHPRARGGRIITSKPWQLLRLYARRHYLNGHQLASCFRPGEMTQRQQGILNSAFTLSCRQHPDQNLPLGIRMYRASKQHLSPTRQNRRLWLTLKDTVRQLQRRLDPIRPWLMTRAGLRGLYAVVRAEQTPNPSSRVSLSHQRDALGMPRLQLDWRLNELDKHSVRVLMETFDQELRRLELGRVELAPWLNDSGTEWEIDPLISTHPLGGYHHMGTTRMASHPSRGVVDQNSRVFGLDNLFVAGSSVFSTSGWANPTLTLLALSLRLAHYLDKCCRQYQPGSARVTDSSADQHKKTLKRTVLPN